MKVTIDFSDFQKLDIRIGTVLSAEPNARARVPAYILTLDFGPLGTKTTSAQITENYDTQQLIGKQIAAIVNFPAKRVAGVKSEVLLLAAVCENNGTVILQPESRVENGAPVA